MPKEGNLKVMAKGIIKAKFLQQLFGSRCQFH
jgi:hypothetical protein